MKLLVKNNVIWPGLIALVTFCSSFASAANRIILIDGSSSISPFVQKAGGQFAVEHKIGVTIQGNGSKIGYECAISKKCQIGMTSAELSPEEAKDINVIRIAYDGVGIIVSKDLTVSNVTTEQLRKIYSGQITNWKEVGGADQTIRAWQRREASSIRDLFNTTIKVSPTFESLGSNQEAFNRLKKTNGGIVYVSLGQALADHGQNVKVLKIDGVEPNEENVRTGKYKIKRAFYLTRHKDLANDAVLNDFTEYLLSSRKALFPDLGLIIP
jgi:phosphate transport system substrate-binding protein